MSDWSVLIVATVLVLGLFVPFRFLFRRTAKLIPGGPVAIDLMFSGIGLALIGVALDRTLMNHEGWDWVTIVGIGLTLAGMVWMIPGAFKRIWTVKQGWARVGEVAALVVAYAFLLHLLFGHGGLLWSTIHIWW